MHSLGLTHIQYQGETFPFPLVLAFHLVLGKFHIYSDPASTEKARTFLSQWQESPQAWTVQNTGGGRAEVARKAWTLRNTGIFLFL